MLFHENELFVLAAGLPLILKYAEIEVIPQSVCRAAWGALVHAGNVCVLDSALHITPCIGDSGSPLVVNGELHGAYSWGEIWCEADVPSLYTSVPYHRSWITEVTGVQ